MHIARCRNRQILTVLTPCLGWKHLQIMFLFALLLANLLACIGGERASMCASYMGTGWLTGHASIGELYEKHTKFDVFVLRTAVLFRPLGSLPHL